MAMRKPEGAKSGAGAAYARYDDSWARVYPTLVDFLTESTWEGGAARQVGTLLFCMDGNVLKCCVHDRDGKQSAWLSAQTFEGLLADLELALVNDALAWRPDKVTGQRR